MATIGQALTAPEIGWKRYDDSHELIRFKTTMGRNTGSTTTYNGTNIHNKTVGADGDWISFYFVGTKLRIIGITASGYSGNIEIDIDDVKGTFSQAGTSTIVWTALNYEKTDLPQGIHKVTITNKTNGYSMMLDAIDIDSTGTLTEPNIKTRLEDMVIGDKINCGYSRYGNFRFLGKADAYPFTSPTTPPADSTISAARSFYFIYVGKDFKGRMILVADRNVSSSISWDNLNTYGIATKDGVEVTSLGLDSAQWKTNIRLLTGGTSDATKANSEWDKYIVNGPVGGGSDIWNWNVTVATLTSTVSLLSGGQYRVYRGYNSLTALGDVLSSNAGTTYGFRPVLVAESLVQPIKNKYLIQDGEEIKKYSESAWQLIGSVPATKEMFNAYGSDFSESVVFNRLIATHERPLDLLSYTIGQGKVFAQFIDLSKYADIKNLNVTPR